MSYSIIDFEETSIIFKLSNNKTIKINSLEFINYCPPCIFPKNKGTHYTVIENNKESSKLGYKIGEVVLIKPTKMEIESTKTRLGIFIPMNEITEDIDGNIIKYSMTTQYELDKYESIHYSISDNAKMYNYIMSILKK